MAERRERSKSSTWGDYDETKRYAAADELRRLQEAREKSERLKGLRMANPRPSEPVIEVL